MTAQSLWRSRAVDLCIWISATDQASVLSAFVQASASLTGLEPAGTAESVAARFASWLAETSQDWLVVLDGLAEAAVPDALWPQGAAGRLLVTSAQPGAISSAVRRGALIIPVGSLSVREALNCLTERLSVNPTQRHGAMELAEEFRFEPLALAQASAVIANSTLACRDYREYFASRRQQIWAEPAKVPAAELTWTLCLGQAESLLPGASVRLMLILAAMLDGHGIPGAIFSAPSVAAYLNRSARPHSPAADPKPAWDALLVLERVGLLSIDRDGAEPVIRMNSLLQAAIRLSAPPQVREAAAVTAAKTLLETWPAEPQWWSAARQRANVASLYHAAADTLWSGGCHPLLLQTGRSLDRARLTRSAVEYWQELVGRCDGKLGPDHPDTQAVAGYLAVALLAAGDAIEAVTWYQRVLAERARELAPGHPGVITAQVSLARALITAGQPADAVTVLQRAAENCEQSRGPGHSDTFAVTEDLASAYRAAGEPGTAVRLLRRILSERERLQGSHHPQTMASRDLLAAACLAQGKAKNAIAHYRRALADRERVLGRHHPDTIETCAGLAAACRAAGRMPSAMELFERCCADSETVLGPDHADTLGQRVNLARVYQTVGRAGDAVELLRDTAIRCERVLSAEDPLLRAVRQDLANLESQLPERKSRRW